MYVVDEVVEKTKMCSCDMHVGYLTECNLMTFRARDKNVKKHGA